MYLWIYMYVLTIMKKAMKGLQETLKEEREGGML